MSKNGAKPYTSPHWEKISGKLDHLIPTRLCVICPIVMHGIDFVTDGPQVFIEDISVKPFEETMKPGMVLMPRV